MLSGSFSDQPHKCVDNYLDGCLANIMILMVNFSTMKQSTSDLVYNFVDDELWLQSSECASQKDTRVRFSLSTIDICDKRPIGDSRENISNKHR